MRSRRFLAAAAAVVIVAALCAAAGCGGKGSSGGPRGLELYESAQEYLMNAASMRLTGSSDMSVNMGAGGGNGGAPQTVRMPTTEEIEQAGSLRVRTSIDTTEMLKAMGLGEGGGGTAVTYLVDGRLYLEIDGRWYYQDYDPAAAGVGLGGASMITPDQIVKTMAAAEAVELVDETDAWAKYHGVLSGEFFGPIVESLRRNLAGTGEDLLAALSGAFSGELNVIIDKSTGALIRFERITRGSDLDLGQGTLMTLETREGFEFSDYGAVFDIRLPEAALNAEPIVEAGPVE